MEDITINSVRYSVTTKNKWNPFKPTIAVAEKNPSRSTLSRVAAPVVLATSVALSSAQAQEAQKPTAEAKEGAKDTVSDGEFSGLLSAHPDRLRVRATYGDDDGKRYWNAGADVRLVKHPFEMYNFLADVRAGTTIARYALDEQGEHRQNTGNIYVAFGPNFWDQGERRKLENVLALQFVGSYERAWRSDHASIKREGYPRWGIRGVLKDGPLQADVEYTHIDDGRVEGHKGFDGEVEGDLVQGSLSYDLNSTIVFAQARGLWAKADLEGRVNGVPVEFSSDTASYAARLGIAHDTSNVVGYPTFVAATGSWEDKRSNNKASFRDMPDDHNEKFSATGILGAQVPSSSILVPRYVVATGTIGEKGSYDVGVMFIFKPNPEQ